MAEETPAPLRTVEPPETPAPSPPRNPGAGYTICDFCQCKLAGDGKVLQMSPEARSFRDDKENHAKAIAKLDEQITELRATITAKDAELAALKGSASAPKKGASFL
jgi:hypothetical protein